MIRWPRPAALSARDRRALAVGALVLLPTLGFAWGVRPIMGSMDALRSQTERERDLLQREVDLLAGARGFPARYARAEHELLAEAPRLFGGPDLVTASAALASYVGGQATGHRVMVQQSETAAPAAAAPGLARLTIEVRAVSDLEGILGWLATLEQGSKLVAVERLTIQPATRVVGTPAADQGVLGVAATIAGYALADSAEAARQSGAVHKRPQAEGR